ncbi:MAG: XRE family transcriptional regulator [Pseudomonadota bacterium]
MRTRYSDDLGANVRSLRRERDMTLSAFSDVTGISTSTLSKVENGHLSLSYEKLLQISRSLDVDITRLFSGSGQSRLSTGRFSINRKDDGQPIETELYSHKYLSPDLLGKRMDSILADPKARTMEEFGDFIRHPGEEFAYIVSGSVAFHSESYAPVQLSAGDSIYFDSSMGHAYLAVGPEPCRVLSVCVDEEGKLQTLLETLRITKNP